MRESKTQMRESKTQMRESETQMRESKTQTSQFLKTQRKKISIQVLNNKYFYENFNLNFSLQNKKLQQIKKNPKTKPKKPKGNTNDEKDFHLSIETMRRIFTYQ